MLRPLRIARAFGIPIYLHWTFVLLPMLVIYLNLDKPVEMLALHMAVVGAGFFCVVLHELGHALAARGFGVGTRDITLYPIGGIASLERMPEQPWQEFWIAVAGPAVNVVIAAVLFPVVMALLVINPALISDTFLGQLAAMVLGTNVILVLFNMIPAFPMDGGRVLRSLLALGLGQLRATRIAVRVGMVMALLMAALGAYLSWHGQSPMPLVIAFFILMVGPRELQILEARERARWDEPLPVLPVRRVAPLGPPLASLPGFMLQPQVKVYTWDDREGVWVPDGLAGPRPER